MRAVLLFAVLSLPSIAGADEESRLSSSVSLVSRERRVSEWLRTLDRRTFVEAKLRFPATLGDDVIFGIDQELIEGTSHPRFVKGGDWMGLVGVQRSGNVWVARGTADTMNGTPSADRAWEILSLDRALKPDTWYHARTVIDFSSRRFVSFTFSGPDWTKRFDLSAFTLDYPNYIPFDGMALSNYAFAMRGKGLIKDDSSTAAVFFDDLHAGFAPSEGRDEVRNFTDSFDSGSESIPKQELPFSVLFGGSIALAKYEEGARYKENDRSLVRTIRAPFSVSGDRVLVADATLQSIDYDSWFTSWAEHP